MNILVVLFVIQLSYRIYLLVITVRFIKNPQSNFYTFSFDTGKIYIDWIHLALYLTNGKNWQHLTKWQNWPKKVKIYTFTPPKSTSGKEPLNSHPRPKRIFRLISNLAVIWDYIIWDFIKYDMRNLEQIAWFTLVEKSVDELR